VILTLSMGVFYFLLALSVTFDISQSKQRQKYSHGRSLLAKDDLPATATVERFLSRGAIPAAL
jgi:hypothetical protein